MAESPPRSDTPDSSSGDDPNAPRPAGEGDPAEDTGGPWGDARPWWSSDPGAGTGPQIVIRDASGGHPVVPDGTGPLPAVPGPPAAPLPPGPPVPGPPPLPRPPSPGARQSAGGAKRFPKVLLVWGVAAVGAVVVMAGMLAFRTDTGGIGGTGGGTKPTAGADARAAGGPAPTTVISAGATAGGLRMDGLTSPQASAAYPFVAAAVEAAGVPVAERGTAVYSEEPTRPVNVLFVGGTGQVGDPADFLQKARPTTFIIGQGADPGAKGGKAVCGTFAVLADTHTYCAWATADSYGVVASNRPSFNPRFALMADIMRRIRKDVERPR
ncbi:hypothetical protein E1264_09385 [Actinomadura sp. KC216]|uniref:hypothetical protein n=1 Tax=Actinomadura sp. KC216 TaxID=2530370 RepID=UPI001047A7E6|nr:hypothetical protein [Actinomadura sp. KC216]TDB89084.1 hypothetical protein E1264_09385 [Actinomadura sp. KC216]